MKPGRKPGVTKMTAFDSLIRQRAAEGFSVAAIALEVGMSRPSIRTYCKRERIDIIRSPRSSYQKQKPSKTERCGESIRAMAAGGQKASQIANSVGLNVQSVRKFCKKHGIDLIDGRLEKKGLQNRERNAAILRLYLENHTLEEVGNKFGLSRERVRQLLNKMGISPRDGTKLNRTQPPRKTQTFSERFWGHVDKSPGQGPQGDCWIWRGARWSNGYGRFASLGKTFYAHRLVYLLHNRRGLAKWALHHCDNPSCVNPAHIYDGTPADNVRDRDARGRSAYLADREGWLAARRESLLQNERYSPQVFSEIEGRIASGEAIASIAKSSPFGEQTLYKIARGEHFFQKQLQRG